MRRASLVRCGLVGALVLSMLAALVVLIAMPAHATIPGAEDPNGEVPLVCADDALDGLALDHRYAAVWVPAGATITFYASGEIVPEYYIGSGRGQYALHADLWLNSTLINQEGHAQDVGIIPGIGPFNPVSFTNSDLGSWTNNKGYSALFGLDVWAGETYAGLGLEWALRAEVTGGDLGSCARSVDGSELFGPNPALGQQCPPCHGGTSGSVDTHSGNEHRALPGVSVAGRGPSLEFRLAHNSLDAGHRGALGSGWGPHGGMGAGWRTNGGTVRREPPSRDRAPRQAQHDPVHLAQAERDGR